MSIMKSVCTSIHYDGIIMKYRTGQKNDMNANTISDTGIM